MPGRISDLRVDWESEHGQAVHFTMDELLAYQWPQRTFEMLEDLALICSDLHTLARRQASLKIVGDDD